MPDWKEGTPPEFIGQKHALVAVELPSRFSGVNVVSYRCVRWLGECWSDKEVFRARRWMEIPLPNANETTEQPRSEALAADKEE